MNTRARHLLPEHVVAELLHRLNALYGVKFAEAYASVPPDELKRVWRQALAGYAVDEMRCGLAACLARPWPPTLPEFLLLCRPPPPGLEPELAYQEAVAKLALREQGRECSWSHPAIYHAACEVTPFDLQRLPWPAIKSRWSATLAKHLANPDCPPVPPIPPALRPPATRGPNAQEAAALAQFRQRWSDSKKPLTSFRVRTSDPESLPPKDTP